MAELTIEDQINSIDHVINELQEAYGEGNETRPEGGVMINDYDIKAKDFSISLPGLIDKLEFMGLSLEAFDNIEGMHTRTITGAGTMLVEIAEDLSKINKALYGETETQRKVRLFDQLVKLQEEGYPVERFMKDLLNDEMVDMGEYLQKEAPEAGEP